MTKIAVEYQNYQRSELMKELAFAAHGREYREQTSSATYAEIQNRIAKMALLPGSRILDAGCGSGAFSLPLAEEFSFYIDGIDLGEELIARAKKLAGLKGLSEKCNFFSGDFAISSAYQGEMYDAIICIGSLYWGQDLSSILAIWHRITLPGAQLLLFLNLAYTPLYEEEKKAIGHTQFFSPLSMQQELSKYGWAVCDWEDETPSYIKWLQRWCNEMEKLEPSLVLEMKEDGARQLSNRFKTYLELAQRGAVRRIILRAEHV